MTGRESQWKGIGRALWNPLLENHGPWIVRLAHQSSRQIIFACGGACQEAAPQGAPLENWIVPGLVPSAKWLGMRSNCSQWDLSGLGDGEPLQWLTLVSQNGGKRSWEAEDKDGPLGGRRWGQLCFFSQRLSEPVSFCDGSPLGITHQPFRNSSPPSSRWIILLPGSPK